ncbi:EAL domain-containing protein [Pseudoalteromonas sp. CR1]|uniref:EAL domain-containing protein n=1 Tax=Pseudoalteromonas sp. CR1 TaxID=2861964 RepID=UPI001C5F0226|nr:EAL domain-containing protein [Pseudoalteromonas sp. CR1]MBW4965865.1 EAL domain-containing protein [Pseudoalteromonas sp. CR1]
MLCITNAVASQNYAQQLQRLSTDEGLSQNYVEKIQEDEIGYIWIATQQGLNRFDGYTVETFDGGFELDKHYISTLLKTNDGKLLVSTDIAGAYLIDPQTLKTEKIYSGQLDKETQIYSPVSAMAGQNELYYLAIDNQILTYNKTTGAFTQTAALANKTSYIRALTIHNNTLYIGANDGLYAFNLISNQLAEVPLHPAEQITIDNINLKFLQVDKELGLLVGTVEGLYRFAFSNDNQFLSSKITTLISDLNIWDYITSDDGDFVATEKGLFSFSRINGEIELILNYAKSKFNINDNTISDLTISQTGVLWLSSRSQGVFTWPINTRRFKNINLPVNNTINKIHEDDDNIIWFGTNDGLAQYNPKTETTRTFLNSTDTKAVFGSSAVYDIFASSLGNSQYLWLYTYNGFELFDKNSKQLVSNLSSNNDLLTQPTIFGFAKIDTHKYAFANDKNFYLFNEKTGDIRVIKGLKNLLDPINAYVFLPPLETHPNELLISMSNSLVRYNEETQNLTSIFQSSNTKGNIYYTVDNYYLDLKRNILWLATTHEGLIGIDPQSYEKKHSLSLKNSLNSNSILSLVPDEKDYLWASSENGLYKINLNTLSVISFSVKDGLNTNKFTDYTQKKLNNGQIIIGSNAGAILFNPADFKTKKTTKKHKLAITDVSLLTRELPFSPIKYSNQPLKLNHDDMGLTVSFSDFSYPDTNKTFYYVVLDGPTSLTYENLKANQVFFTKLQPGDYSLTINAHFKDGVIKTQPVKLSINVAHAPWKSPFALFTYIIITLTLFALFFWQYRNRQNVIQQAHTDTINSKKQTELALRNNKSGVWDYQFLDRSVNTLRGIELGYENLEERVAIEQFFSIIHPDDKRRFETKWQNYISNKSKNKNWQLTFRLRHKNGHWLWYQDTGQIIFDTQTGKPLYVSGIYTNITEQRVNEEQAKILGEAFGQINDWLLILDDHLLPFSANNSFIGTFSDTQTSTNISPKLFIKSLGIEKCKEFAKRLKALQPTENWHIDTLIKTAKNNKHPVHINVTAVAKSTTEVSYYVIVISDLTEQKRAENELRYLANYDALTKLPNRSLMYQNIEEAIKQAESSNTHCALLFIDLDKFKPVNDSFGHAVGDKLLCNITERVSNILDANSQLGRQSGDEFLVLIKNVESQDSLKETVKLISKELANKVMIEDFAINISASIGVALYPFDAITTDILIRNADVAMMQAKQNGRNDFSFFSDEMNEQIKQKLLLENDLKDAVKADLLFNHYQPIIDIEAKTINGVELLMRWKNKGQFVSPAVFIPISEETGLIEHLTELALKRALIELAPLLNENPLFYISLNLSPKHILKANITDRLEHILKEFNVQTRQLRLEITESILLEDKYKAAKQLQALKTAGFKLLLDDFGTGYSSLTYLSQFPINVIKIDQSFVNSIGEDKGDESIIKTILSLAENLNLYCIAEGVENREQMEFLANAGCHVLQGYYFARPMSAEALKESSCFSKIIELI